MISHAFHLPISQLGDTGTHWQRNVVPPGSLRYCPPSSGCWGILRVGLLVPESVLLFASPAGCGRHGAIAGLQIGYKNRLYLLYVDELDVVLSRHEQRISDAVDELLSAIKQRPKALVLCSSCIDDLLGSDYDSLARDLEARHGLPVRTIHMDPIAMDGKTPPMLTAQQGIYDFLEPSSEKDSGVNVVGNFVPLHSESELPSVLSKVGIEEVRHIGSCPTFQAFQRMSASRLNLLVRPEGRLAVRHMQTRLGIPHVYVPVAYGLDSIDRNYRLLEESLGLELPTAEYRADAEKAAERYRRELGPLSIAVGSTNGGAFELARALTEYGFQVRYLFADQVLDFDLEHVEWLKRHVPDLRVYTSVHPTMVDFLKLGLEADLALGFDAGYYCSGARTVPLTVDSQPYGFRGVEQLFKEMVKAMECPYSHRELLYSSGLVI